jgi:hypothetical protein
MDYYMIDIGKDECSGVSRHTGITGTIVDFQMTKARLDAVCTTRHWKSNIAFIAAFTS